MPCLAVVSAEQCIKLYALRIRWAVSLLYCDSSTVQYRRPTIWQYTPLSDRNKQYALSNSSCSCRMRQRLLSRLFSHEWHPRTQIQVADAFVANYERSLKDLDASSRSQVCLTARLGAWTAGQHLQERHLQVPQMHQAMMHDMAPKCSAWNQNQSKHLVHPLKQNRQQCTATNQQQAPSDAAAAGSNSQKQGSSTEAKQEEQPSTSSSGSNSNSSSTEDTGSSSSSSSREPPDEALLAEWRTASSQWYGRGLNYIVSGHLTNPEWSSWSSLYQHNQTILERLLSPPGASFMTWLFQWMFRQAKDVAVPLLEEAHADFELDGFKDGASQAIAAVLELYAIADWTSLRPMVSSGLLQSMQNAYQMQQDLADQHNFTLGNISVSVDKLEISCVHSITQQQLAEIDERRSDQQLTATEIEASPAAAAAAAAAEGAAAVPYWDVVHVYAEVTWQASLNAPADADDIVMPKCGHWVFCRGPVPVNKPVAADADKPWFMLAWL